MTLMNLLGLLSLISLIILLIIYILKPNYQQQFISSTYIWKLSLKYRKKKLPTSKLRNLLLILCQVLLLLTLTAILTKPVNITKEKVENESIIIIDASASMRTTLNEETRFDRAIKLAKEKANETFEKDGAVTIVISSDEPYFLVERASINYRQSVNDELDSLKSNIFSCSYGETELVDSITFCHDILIDNPNANIYIYTDTTITYVDEGINIVNVCTEGEYNFAILDSYAEIIDNYYSFVVEVAGYGRDESVKVDLYIYGANATELDPTGTTYNFTKEIDLSNDTTKRLIFINELPDSFNEDENTEYFVIDEMDRIFSYESAHIEIDVDDCFFEDNYFEIYGGTKETIKLIYVSNKANSFFNGIIFVLRDALQNKYHIDYTEYKKNYDIPNSGYDIYIYEHDMAPDSTPTDGVVIYADPMLDVQGTGFSVYGYSDLSGISVPLIQIEDHPIAKNLDISAITLSRYTDLSSLDSNYEVIATIDNKPAIVVKNEENLKIVVLLFSMHYSNLPVLKEFPLLMYNIIDYFLPATVEGNAFEVNDDITVNSRSQDVRIMSNEDITTLSEFPSTIKLAIPGTYTIEQTTFFGKELSQKIFAKIPKNESNTFPKLDVLSNPISNVEEYDYVFDWIFYLAIALCFFSFVEWLLKGDESV